MAIALGKLTLIVGAGLVGAALSKEGRLSDVTGLFSGAFKIVSKHLQQDKDNSRSSGKTQSDSLLTQVNSLREELQLLASSRSVTIVTAGGSGSRTYGVTVVIVAGVVGYAYIWWKGWKLSDMMFVTRRNFSNACTTVENNLAQVSTSVVTTEKDLTLRIENVDSSVQQCLDISSGTREEVLQLHGDLSGFHQRVEYVQGVVQNLERKLVRIDESQEYATRGVYNLVKFVQELEQTRNVNQVQMLPSSSKPALESPPQATSVTVTGAATLPPIAPPSPSATETPQILRPSTTLSASALKDLQVNSRTIRTSTSGTSTSRPVISEISVEELPFLNQTRSMPRFAPRTIGTPSVQVPAATGSSNQGGWFKLPSILARSRSSAT